MAWNCSNYSFSIPNEIIKATTATGSYPLGLFQIDESYKEIEPLVKVIWRRFRSFSFKDHSIKHCLCCDYKMELIVIN